MVNRNIGTALVAGLFLLVPGPGFGDTQDKQTPVLRIGAVAYAPSAVTVFEGMRRYFAKNDLPMDYVLYSNYDALVKALYDGHVDIAWNTPLAHARYHLRAGGRSQTLVMRDVDCGFRCKLVVSKDSAITAPADLAGKTLVLGSWDAAEATVLPVYYLKKKGVDIKRVRVVSLDKEVDLRGNPCCSESYVLRALEKGRGDAGIISERLWEQVSGKAAGLKAVWTSPPFSHCVFTAAKDFDRKRGERFARLMLAMDPHDPLTAEVMKLEGTRKWVKGSPDGFEVLLKALRSKGAAARRE